MDEIDTCIIMHSFTIAAERLSEKEWKISHQSKDFTKN